MKSSITFIVTFFFTIHLSAQDPLTPRGNQYFFLGVGLPIVKVRDEGHSSLIYKGMNPTLRVGHERIGTNVVSRICFSVSAGQIKPNTRPKPEKQLSNADISTIEISYAYYRRTKNAYDTEGWNTYVGGVVSLLFDGRNYNLPSNNLFGYQANLSLNAGGYVQKKINTSWRMNNELYTPLLTFAMRPNYIGLMPMTTTDFSAKRMLKAGKIVTLNKVFRLYNRLGFDQQINAHRQRRIAYTWDGQVNRVSRPLNLVSAGVSYESLFKM